MANTFRLGDQVRFSFGTRELEGFVVEDRGSIGVRGRRLYAVEFRRERHSDTTSLIELSAEDMEPVRRAGPARSRQQKAQTAGG